MLVLGLTVGLASRLETNFFDDAGQNTISVTQKMPAGTSLAATDAAAKKVEAVLAGLDEVETYQVSIGGGGHGLHRRRRHRPGDLLDHRSTPTPTSRPSPRRCAASSTRSDAGEIRFGAGGGGFGSSELQVLVQAADDETLAAAAEAGPGRARRHAGSDRRDHQPRRSGCPASRSPSSGPRRPRGA